MNLQIISIHNHGDAQREYVVFKVVADCILGEFVLSDTTYINEKTISNRLRHMYWWVTSEKARKGDFIYVYTREGKDTTRVVEGVTHRDFFWNLKSSVWNNNGDAAVLMHVDEWQFKQTAK